jgi:hypothetical protein
VEQRKALPLATGLLDYFPDALLVVAEVSRVGNEQHHPGAPLHWDKSKSTDEADALMRHLLDRGKLDTDGLRHSGKVAWRALAMLQRELDAEAEVVVEVDPEDTIDITDLIRAWSSGAVRLLNRDVKFMEMDLSDGPSYNVSVEDWGNGDGPIIRLGDSIP